MKSVQPNKLYKTYIYEYLLYRHNNEWDKSLFNSANKMAALTDEGTVENSELFIKHA
jgi:hypothetical protein